MRLWTRGLIAAGVAGMGFALMPPYTLRGDAVATVERSAHPVWPEADDGRFRVASVNLAHGRGEGLHQLLQRSSETRANLRRVAELLRRERPHVVGLQEADGPSVWSGSFDHVAALADDAGYPYRTRGEHVGGIGLSYGTALLSGWRIEDPTSHVFQPSPPTPSKGFVAARVQVGGQIVEVLSVHLDFARAAARRAQVAEIVAVMGDSGLPRVVMGDLNTGWGATIERLCEGLDLVPHQPDAQDMDTFPTTGERLDWILVSPEIDVVAYRTLPDTVSDHKVVVAELELSPAAAR